MDDPQDREQLFQAFELAWQQGDEPTVAQFAQDYAAPLAEVGAAAAADILHELVAIDLEWRWKRAGRRGASGKTVEEYWRELPALGPPEAIPGELVAEEYRVRKQWADRPSHAEFAQRFPTRVAELLPMLAEVDEELRLDRDAWSAVDGANAPSRAGAASLIADDSPATPPIGLAWVDVQNYLLHEMIGAGQMGRVYRATHLPTAKPIAVKYLRKAFYGDPHAIERFLEEARLLSQLTHPGLAPIRSVGRTPAGGYFLEIELLPGPDLARIIVAGQVAIDDAVRWTVQAAETIAHAHRAGIVHCDLKPGNLVLDGERNVRVTDFGLARTTNSHGVVPGNRLAGTAPFMAPEQVSEWWGPIGPWTDVYGLGALLFTLLSGRPPFSGTTVADVLAKVVSGASPPSIQELRPELSTRLAKIIETALEKSPDGRFQSAEQLAIELRATDC